MPVYFGMYLLQQMTLAAMFSWWLTPLVSKGVKLESEFSPPLPFWEASPPRNGEGLQESVDH
jgi:hypothetical protein